MRPAGGAAGRHGALPDSRNVDHREDDDDADREHAGERRAQAEHRERVLAQVMATEAIAPEPTTRSPDPMMPPTTSIVAWAGVTRGA
jgi:hypothetical protein